MKFVEYNYKNNQIQCVIYRDCDKEYPLHTHTGHVVIGMVGDGNVLLKCDKTEIEYSKGDKFIIYPNVAHTIKPGSSGRYSMLVMCIEIETDVTDKCLVGLWKKIVQEPENVGVIEDMAEQVHMSPYHMIRTFKKEFGLTPHHLLVQSKVRKAQKLIEEGCDTKDVTYMAGFFDESHLDKNFQKYIKMTPGEYRESVKTDI